jgi:hypothetical protein
MRLSLHFIALGLALSPMVAAAEPISWSRYQVPETGAAVDIPTLLQGKPGLSAMSLGNWVEVRRTLGRHRVHFLLCL